MAVMTVHAPDPSQHGPRLGAQKWSVISTGARVMRSPKTDSFTEADRVLARHLAVSSSSPLTVFARLKIPPLAGSRAALCKERREARSSTNGKCISLQTGYFLQGRSIKVQRGPSSYPKYYIGYLHPQLALKVGTPQVLPSHSNVVDLNHNVATIYRPAAC
jgi:hypothetical protein